MALSLNPRTDNVPPLNDPRISLRKERLKVSALSMAAQEDPIIRQALLPYPSPGNMEVLAITFGVKRKVSKAFQLSMFVLLCSASKYRMFNVHSFLVGHRS